jgi:hypothetical protein
VQGLVKRCPWQRLKPYAYITALMVISIDGDISEEEEDYIADLQKALNISDKRSDEIIDELFGEEEEEEEDL